jgi:hypothetical protein
MQTTTLRTDQLEYLLTSLQDHYRAFIISHRQPWRSAADRAQAGQVLETSITKARQAVQSLQGTRVPELQHLVRKLIVHSELAAGSLKDPSTV